MGGPDSRAHEKGQVVQKNGPVGGEFGRKKEAGGLKDLGGQEGFV